ncbi:MAG TPA: PEP-CTERM sorting domain-containing protein [Phycisphaerae bacterium]|nr:PEP-CTERM sorting domain-containing protein [Phycisphaerae bacterium]HOI53999.1 PEP-CTERM sorting domain-containing protein [Phycisphaerae bacterium]
MSTRLIIAAGLSVLLAGVASADLVNDATGEVNGWGVTPFSIGGVVRTPMFTLENDYAPINYPYGIGYVPSPGGSDGEDVDLEEMHLRVTATQLKVLVVTSGSAATFSGQTFYLGDLFLTLDGQRYGVVTQSASRGLAAGSVYRIDSADDVAALQGGSRSYLNDTHICTNDYGAAARVVQIAGPWAVDSDIDPAQRLGTAGIVTDTHNYGKKEDGTFLVEYTVDLSLVGGMPQAVNAHMTWGCGNDVIELNSTIVPEPATVALLGFGMGLIVVRRRKASR